METLTFANGQVVNGHCLETDDRLWLYMEKISLMDAFSLLSNPENYRTIRAFRYSTEREITGYTHFYCISEEANGMVSAGIKRN